MAGRKQIQDAHEKAVEQQFAQFLLHSQDEEWLIVQNHTNPPDGLLKRNNKYLWIEIVDVYHNDDEARAERSAVTPSEKRKKHTSRKDRYRGPIDYMAQMVFKEAKKKMGKKNYVKLRDAYGPGVLICCERDPLFDSSIDLEFTLEKFRTNGQKLHDRNENKFKEIYLLEKNGTFYKLFPLPP